MPKFHVQRSATINASPEKVFGTVADFGAWTTWSPWLCAEPEAKVTVSADPSSVGSTYEWKGEVVGAGIIEHQKLEPGRLIDDEIRFIKPFASTSRVTFELKPAGEGTELTWHMNGSLPWFLFWMLSSMEVFIGMDYERGLKMLKEWIETGEILSKTTILGVQPFEALTMAGVRKTCPISDIGPQMEAAFAAVHEKIQQHNLPDAGPAVTLYHDMNVKKQTFDFTAGVVLRDTAGSFPDDLAVHSIPAGQAFCVEHVGSYEHLGNPWSAAHQHVRYKKLKCSKVGGLEIYDNDPRETPPAELRTRVVLPLK